MPDRLASAPAPDQQAVSPDIDSRVESLLLTGLDHYFAGEYERAISAWTRVLFLDRGHARAKAYIDRARGVIAERQRHSEELLHRGVAAFNRGETANARALLQSAVEQAAPRTSRWRFSSASSGSSALWPPPRGPPPGTRCAAGRASSASRASAASAAGTCRS